MPLQIQVEILEPAPDSEMLAQLVGGSGVGLDERAAVLIDVHRESNQRELRRPSRCDLVCHRSTEVGQWKRRGAGRHRLAAVDDGHAINRNRAARRNRSFDGRDMCAEEKVALEIVCLVEGIAVGEAP